MLPRCSALLLLLLLCSATSFQVLPEEAAPRRARFSANSPTDVARCLNGAVTVGCEFFSCLENSTCDTDGMNEICELFLHTAATFNTEVQEECYTSLDICTVARTNPDAIGEVVQVPTHFPNRYYSTLLQTLQACDEETVGVVRAGLVARLGPDMETFLQLVQDKQCPTGSGSAAYNNPSSWRNMPVLNIQPGFRGRDPTHLFARKRSVDNIEVKAEK
ncbi:Stanniocalcin [Channa argus]|uniref:Stanniocalcin n=1 Tax=Channa argus TaxID=215402 RepID=A0A6G1QGL9_CHAAH|nr:Stanniocalcin [Channa argus]